MASGIAGAELGGDMALRFGPHLAHHLVPLAVGEPGGVLPAFDLSFEAGVGPQMMAVRGEMQPARDRRRGFAENSRLKLKDRSSSTTVRERRACRASSADRRAPAEPPVPRLLPMIRSTVSTCLCRHDRQRIVDIDQLLGQLVEVEPALGVAIDFQPGVADRFLRAIPEVEAGALERGMRRIPQARLVERRLQPGPASLPSVIMSRNCGSLIPSRIFQLAELGRLEARRGPEHVAERGNRPGSGSTARPTTGSSPPGSGRPAPSPCRPRRIGPAPTSADRQPELVQHLLQPQFLGLVDDDEQHFIVQVGQRLLGGEQLVELQIIGIGHAGGRRGHGARLGKGTARGSAEAYWPPGRRLLPGSPGC